MSGRSNITDFEEVVKLDTQYINEWSVKGDIKIIWQRSRARESMLDAYPALKKMNAADDGNTEVFYFKIRSGWTYCRLFR